MWTSIQFLISFRVLHAECVSVCKSFFHQILLFMYVYLGGCFACLPILAAATAVSILPLKSHMEIKCLNKRVARRCVYVNYVSHQNFLSLFSVDILIHMHTFIFYALQCQCWHFQFNIYWLMHSSFTKIASFAEFLLRTKYDSLSLKIQSFPQRKNHVE